MYFKNITTNYLSPLLSHLIYIIEFKNDDGI